MLLFRGIHPRRFGCACWYYHCIVSLRGTRPRVHCVDALLPRIKDHQALFSGLQLAHFSRCWSDDVQSHLHRARITSVHALDVVLRRGFRAVLRVSEYVLRWIRLKTNLIGRSMAVKSYRIDRIFNWHRKKLTKIKPIGDSQLMVIVSILLGLEVVSHLMDTTSISNDTRSCLLYGKSLVAFELFNSKAFQIQSSVAIPMTRSPLSSLKSSTSVLCS